MAPAARYPKSIAATDTEKGKGSCCISSFSRGSWGAHKLKTNKNLERGHVGHVPVIFIKSERERGIERCPFWYLFWSSDTLTLFNIQVFCTHFSLLLKISLIFFFLRKYIKIIFFILKLTFVINK